jgi:hypothetical protein
MVVSPFLKATLAICEPMQQPFDFDDNGPEREHTRRSELPIASKNRNPPDRMIEPFGDEKARQARSAQDIE